MGRVRICGFEQGNLTAGTPEYGVSGTMSIVTSPVNQSDYALRVNPTGTNAGSSTVFPINSSGAPSGTVAVGTLGYYKVDFRYATKPSANDEPIITILNTSAGLKCEVRINSAGVLALYNGSLGTTLLATGSTALSADTWYRIELKVGTETSTNSSDAVYEVRINGATELSGSNGDFTSVSSGTITLGKRSNRNGNTVDFFYDNVVIDDATWPGESYIKALLPDGAGNYSGATSGTWQDVDERPPDDDTTYLSFTSNTSKHSVSLTSCATAGISGTIVCAQTVCRGRDTGSVTLNHVGFIRSGGTDTNCGTGVNLGTGWSSFGFKLFVTDPSDNAAWTTTKLDALEVGCYLSASNATAQRVTSLMVMVEYVPSSASFVFVRRRHCPLLRM